MSLGASGKRESSNLSKHPVLQAAAILNPRRPVRCAGTPPCLRSASPLPEPGWGRRLGFEELALGAGARGLRLPVPEADACGRTPPPPSLDTRGRRVLPRLTPDYVSDRIPHSRADRPEQGAGNQGGLALRPGALPTSGPPPRAPRPLRPLRGARVRAQRPDGVGGAASAWGGGWRTAT